LDVVRTEEVEKRHGFVSWAARQDCTVDVVARLEAMVHEAPRPVQQWMEPAMFGTPEAAFSGRHILMAGVKRRGGEIPEGGE
jgi:hypothetical protein